MEVKICSQSIILWPRTFSLVLFPIPGCPVYPRNPKEGSSYTGMGIKICYQVITLPELTANKSWIEHGIRKHSRLKAVLD